MLNTPLLALVVGCILGFLAGLGIGGGSLLILWLTLVVGLEHTAARILNLLFFIPTATISSIFRWRQGTLAISTVLPAVLAGCLSAACFSIIGRHMDAELLKRLFGILLLITGAKEVLYKPKSKPPAKPEA